MYGSFADVLPPKQKAVQNSHIMTTSTPLRQLIPVEPVSGNPRGILVPVSLNIINATRKQQFERTPITTGSRATVPTNPILVKSIAQQDDPGSSKGSMLDENSQYPRLELTGKNDHLSLVLM
jgi:hypothetical protein